MGADAIGLSDEATIAPNEGRFEFTFQVAGSPEALLAAVRSARQGGSVADTGSTGLTQSARAGPNSP